MELKRISVVGMGRLGAPMAACFAWKGFPTVGVDVDPGKVRALNQGIAPIHEPRLPEVIHAARGRLAATLDYETAIRMSDVTFIVVPTPSKDDGAFSLEHVLETAKQIGAALRKKANYHLIVLTSTVMPGATEDKVKPMLESSSGKKCGDGFGLCYSPEFIALGSVIRDFLIPDFILIGESDSEAGTMLAGLYESVCDNHPPFARMNIINAELTKLAVNTFVTTKITYANMLARLCERLPGAHVDVVTSALGLDSRIGPKYLKGAIGYGGPCFPRDNRAFANLAHAIGAPATLAEVTDLLNRQQIQWLAATVKQRLPRGQRVGILGLAYKPHSDVVEKSQGLMLAQALAGDGIPVIAYDPEAAENARRVLSGPVALAASIDECIQRAAVVVVTTPWEEFKRLTLYDFVQMGAERVVMDCWRLYEGMAQPPGVVYHPIGIGENPAENGQPDYHGQTLAVFNANAESTGNTHAHAVHLSETL
ncbi:MAG: UDP-glucose/GDP-mannose dehydrogenase family protein [Acidobacteria bacterium]|nr:UDP-glucose/GDP-mannose dehydrogenase family protein [Acidobacteriota bacterium]MBI3658247.1 UDP-glucose/GDP-mannose dehydrogenase family protein [Acidobacteriota bacterium]